MEEVMKKQIFVTGFLALMLVLGSGPVSAEEQAAVRDGVFIHVSSGTENPHRVLMALKMADIMSPDRDVLVYFDIKGVEVVLSEADDLVYAQFASSRTALKTLLDKGVEIYACPGCLKAAGRTSADLMEGVRVADKDAFFGFTQGRILSLDY